MLQSEANPMKFAIYGAGAIGAFLGAKLALSGQETTLIARGPHLNAMRTSGVKVLSPYGDFHAYPKVAETTDEIGPVDVVFLTVKAHSLPEVVPTLAPILDKETIIVSAQNGIPWWYFHGVVGEWGNLHLETVDPGGHIASAIDPARIIGCIVYPSSLIVEPGVIRHTEGNRFAIGEIDGSITERCKRLSSALINAGFKAPIRSRIRQEIWAKLLGNVAFNPLSAITRSTLADIAGHPETASVAKNIMVEAHSVASGLGISIPVTIEQRFAGAAEVGDHKTSMLQDIESGRPTELENIMGAIIELGDKLQIQMPYSQAVYACVRLLTEAMKPNSD